MESELLAAAFLVLLAAAAGAGVISANLGSFSFYLLGLYHLAVFEIPSVCHFFKNGQFMMLKPLTIYGKAGNEFNRSLIIPGASRFGLNNLKPVPYGGF